MSEFDACSYVALYAQDKFPPSGTIKFIIIIIIERHIGNVAEVAISK